MTDKITSRKAFVVGSARSGTTWTLRVLRCHPLVITGPESHVFPEIFDVLVNTGFSPRGRAAALARYDEARAGERFGTEGGGPHRWVDRSTLERLLAEAADLDTTPESAAAHVVGGILDTRFAAKGGTQEHLLVEKTPRHVFYAERILRWWPSARIVEVLRDGRDVCVSLDHLANTAPWAPKDRGEQIRRWVDAVRHGMAVRTNTFAAGRWHTLRYEAMAADPVREISDLFAFLGLPRPPGFAEQVAADTAFENLPRSPRRRKGEVGGWREQFSDDDAALFRRLAGDVLVEAGYEP